MARQIRKHSTRLSQANEGTPDADFEAGQEVMTSDGLRGRVTAVSDSFSPGGSDYEVELDGGMGRGTYTSSQLRATGRFMTMDEAVQQWRESPEARSGMTAEESLRRQYAAQEPAIAAEASGVHLASDDYPEMGSILSDRPDPGKIISVIGHRAVAADSYGRPDDARDDEYNGGMNDTGTYWAEPGQQQWAQENLGPQEEAPPPPWAAAMESPVMARLAQIEEAGQFFGTPRQELHRYATTINGTQIDEHGDAPEHGSVPRASDPDSYDDRSTEGDGDPRWSGQDDPHKKEKNGAAVAMFPEGVSSGNGPGLPIGPVTAVRSGTQAARVPWTDHERTVLHGWDDVPTGTEGDFVPSTEFTGRHRSAVPAEEVVQDELRATAALDPAEEARARDHLLNHHGWNEGGASRYEQTGQRFTDMHAALHSAGMAGHDHDPAAEAAARELSDRFGDPYQAQTGRAHPGQGGMRFDDPGEAIRNAVPRDYERMHREMPIRMLNSRDHDDEDNSLDAGPDTGLDKKAPDNANHQFSGHDSEDDSLDTGEPGDDGLPPQAWPMAGAGITEGGPAYTQGKDDGNRGQVFPPPPPAPAPDIDGDGEDEDGDGVPGDDDSDGKGKKISLEIKAHLGAFEAAVRDPRFRFEFTAAWSDVVAKAKRLRSQGYVRIVHASSGMIIGEVRGDHDTYETGIQRPPGKPQTIQHWACGCPWASFHQKTGAITSRYAGRPCSHVMALQFEAQARGMFGRDIAPDGTLPSWSKPEVTVKSWPPYEGDPHRGHWNEYWQAPSAQHATAALLAAGEELGDLLALASLGGFTASLRGFTADQANAPWGSENVSHHPPQKPYGATQPPNKDTDPGSYGPLAAPDPANWGGIQEDSYLQMPLSSSAASLREPLPPHLAYPAPDPGAQEDQESFGYSSQAPGASSYAPMAPADPQGLLVDAELHGEPEPALPSTTGEDEIEATAAADGTIGGDDAGTGGPDDWGAASPALMSSWGSREEFRRKFGGTPMGDLNRETSPQAQQPSVVTQEPGMGSMDDALSPEDPSIQTIGAQQWSGEGTDDTGTVPAGEPQGSIDDIVASFQRSAAAGQYNGGGGPGGGAGMGDGDIAAAARQFLSKTADVLPAREAAELIEEGRGQRARNLGLLRLEGTHYEEEDDDLARRGVSLDDFDDDVISV